MWTNFTSFFLWDAPQNRKWLNRVIYTFLSDVALESTWVCKKSNRRFFGHCECGVWCRYLAHMYTAECLVALDCIADGIDHLNPDLVTDIGAVFPAEQKPEPGCAEYCAREVDCWNVAFNSTDCRLDCVADSMIAGITYFVRHLFLFCIFVTCGVFLGLYFMTPYHYSLRIVIRRILSQQILHCLGLICYRSVVMMTFSWHLI